jgi:hypothetical protein
MWGAIDRAVAGGWSSMWRLAIILVLLGAIVIFGGQFSGSVLDHLIDLVPHLVSHSSTG